MRRRLGKIKELEKLEYDSGSVNNIALGGLTNANFIANGPVKAYLQGGGRPLELKFKDGKLTGANHGFHQDFFGSR